MTLFFTIMAAFLQSQSEHFQEYYSLFKPSAFESEILPLHKLRLCNGDFALAGGRGQQSLPYKCFRIWDTAAFSQSASICRREDKAQYKDIHLYAWASCLMSGAGLLIYQAMQNRKTCMLSMKRQTDIIGRSLQNAISRSFRKAAQRESALRQGNLLLPCLNLSQASMSRISCYSYSQIGLKKNMVWSVFRHCTITS